jgi:hypothetical protein
MKYIRTEDKKGKQYILDVKDYIFLIRAKEVIFTRGYKEELLGQADTIEELCDVFVYVDEGCYPEISDDLDLMQTSTTIIYGAIWTDKGLIYKAKMKGILPSGEIDWELL